MSDIEFTYALQLRSLEGVILAHKEFVPGGYSEITGPFAAMSAIVEATKVPRRSSLCLLVNGRIAWVMSAPHALDESRDMSNAAGMLGYAATVATHRLELAAQPEYQLIPPPMSMQKLYFGADSDEANIAAAALIDRVGMMIWRGELRELGPEGVNELFWSEFHKVDDVFGEINDSNIRDEISERFRDKNKDRLQAA